MIDKLIVLGAIILMCVGVISIFLAREFIRKKHSVDNENIVVRNIKLFGFFIVVISLVTIYFCVK